jgi:hypothetical protein
MIQNHHKTSLLVASELPEFVRDDPNYQNFVLFLQAYYEWMEQNGKVSERTQNLLSYKDIDTTTAEFLDFYLKEFLPFFPQETLISKQQAVKFAREFYQSKGTISSYKFLFKILYNSEFDVFYTKDAVLKASDGVWYVAKSLKLATTDPRFLEIKNYRVFGEETKSIATIETSVLNGTRTDVFISNIQRLFQSGEFVRIVDNNNQDVIIDGQPLRAKLVGQISNIRINPRNRGLLYEVGDPVVVFGGLEANTDKGASAIVSSVTSGSIQRINVLNGGYGFREDPNTTIQITNAAGASAIVGSIDPSLANIANVALIPVDTISLKRFIQIGANNYNFSNIAISNANTTLVNAFSFTSFSTYPISSVFVTNGGGGITKIPVIDATSFYENDIFEDNDLSKLGILAPIQILNGGSGYQANDVIVFSGGSGVGARANVTSVTGTGSITRIEYIPDEFRRYPVGGFGYRVNDLPGVTVQSANVQASNASIFVPGILGTGESLIPIVDRVGSVTTIRVIDAGEDYISTPNVSLKVQDIVVSNVYIENLPIKGDVIYQGANVNTSSYAATVNSISILQADADPTKTIWNLRVFNYNSKPNTQINLTIDKNIFLSMANTQYDSNYDVTGVRTYGDGTAKANASFLNGLSVSEGQYLSSKGQPSSFSVIQSEIYNNYTYQVTVEKEIAKYRDMLMSLIHPTGMRVVGRYAMKANGDFYFRGLEALDQGYPLRYYTGYTGSTVVMHSDFSNKSNNIIKFENLIGANIESFITPGETHIQISPTNGPNVTALITSMDSIANTVTIQSNVWLTFANVATVLANSGSNVINILTVTDAYDIVNNKNYSNPNYPIKDIVFAGDTIKVASNTQRTVTLVDYANNKIYVNTNFGANINSYMSVARTFVANTSLTSDQIFLFGPVGQQYIPELITQDGLSITTQDGRILLLG